MKISKNWKVGSAKNYFRLKHLSKSLFLVTPIRCIKLELFVIFSFGITLLIYSMAKLYTHKNNLLKSYFQAQKQLVPVKPKFFTIAIPCRSSKKTWMGKNELLYWRETTKYVCLFVYRYLSWIFSDFIPCVRWINNSSLFFNFLFQGYKEEEDTVWIRPPEMRCFC